MTVRRVLGGTGQVPGTVAPVMLSFVSSFTARLGTGDAVARHGVWRVRLLVGFHLAAIAIMIWSEVDLVARAAFVLTWGLLNFVWLVLLRRPVISSALSLAMIAFLVVLSRFKHDVVQMTVGFIDLMIVDYDSLDFLFNILPSLRWSVPVVVFAVVSLLVLIWSLDTFQVRRRTAAAGTAACFAGLSIVSLSFPSEPWMAYYDDNYISKFFRSGVESLSELAIHGVMESDAVVKDRLKSTLGDTCQPASPRPHVIMVHDESSFDIRVAPGVKAPADYGPHFRSFDGKERHFLVEGAGGPSWYTELSVLTGLSSRSFGRFAYFSTQIAAGRVQRGLPQALRRCGYRTFSLYPAMGAFMSARSFQKSAGVQKFLDSSDLGTRKIEPDSFFYDAASQIIGRERADGPMFMFVYLAANHYPWDFRYRPDLTPEWSDLGGNRPDVNEYLRRQSMSFRDYAEFKEHLKRNFPGESFLLVRYGDHQPAFASFILEPGIGDAGIAQRLGVYSPRYYTTYYAIDAINYRPPELSSALDTLDAPFLPIVVQEAAGLPLDPSFAEQKKILLRCNGIFYACNAGAEARRFNRLLIDAGLIKGL
jgi:hypothetical protein